MLELERSDLPFKHATCSEAISTATADRLRDLVTAFDDWSPAKSDFYRNSLYHFTAHDVPSPLDTILTPELNTQVHQALERTFAVTLNPTARMMLNRFAAGDGTLIHNDYMTDTEHPYFFTHRALLYLNDGWDPSMGGMLGIFDKSDATEPVAIIEPQHNTMSAMAMGPNSYHAVSAQRGPIRYSVVWSFSTADGRHQL